MAKLSVKEQRFVDAYLGSCAGNATAACRVAGYAGSPAVLGVQGVRMLGKAKVRAVIQAREKKREVKEILTAEQRDKQLSQIALSDPHTGHKIAAIRELNICSGRHSIKHVLDVTEKLGDIIGAAVARR